MGSASVRIPAAVMAAAKLSLDQPVDIPEKGGRVIIEPLLEPAFSLEDLLAAVTDENIHEKADFGRLASNAGFVAHDLGGILRLVRHHQPRLPEAWHEFFGTG
nr:hypothetical protein [uncultured Rhodopila sp.]